MRALDRLASLGELVSRRMRLRLRGGDLGGVKATQDSGTIKRCPDEVVCGRCVGARLVTSLTRLALSRHGVVFRETEIEIAYVEGRRRVRALG